MTAIMYYLSPRPLHLMNRYAFRQYYPNLLRTFWHRLCVFALKKDI